MSLLLNQIGTELVINLEQVCYAKKIEDRQIEFSMTNGDTTIGIFPSPTLRDAAWDELSNTNPGAGRGLGQQ